MTRRRKSARGPRRLVGGLAIGLALAWSASAHLLWQVESGQDANRPSTIRLVVSPLEPSTPRNHPASGKTTKETPRSVTQPVLPDGEAPAPCRVRRSLSPDVEVLASFGMPDGAAQPAVPVRIAVGVWVVPPFADATQEPVLSRLGVPARFPRPPPDPA